MNSEQLLLWSQLGASGVTAFATLALVYVTATLTRETKRLADLGQQPQVVATIEARSGSGIALDLVIVNTGTATAYDIKIESTPPFATLREERGIPLQRLSLLKPGQEIRSLLAYYADLTKQPYTVCVSWAKAPQSKMRDRHEYVIDVTALEGATLERDNLHDISRHLEQIQKDLNSITSGFKRLSVNAFDSKDRLREQRNLNRRLR